MNTLKDWLPLLKDWLPLFAAIVSATALLLGYGYQKNLERDAETRKTRQEIYSRLIRNITDTNTMLGRFEQSPEYMNTKPEERAGVEKQFYLKDTEATKYEGERTEIVASLFVYGTDEAIYAYVNYARANVEGRGGNLGELVLSLRHSIYGKQTHIKVNDANLANLAIWTDPKYLGPSAGTPK